MAIRRISKVIADLKRKAFARSEKTLAKTRRKMELQSLEDRSLMATLPVAIDPQPGAVLSETATTTLNAAPTEIKFDFEAFGSIKVLGTTPQAQTAELSKSIVLKRAGADGIFGIAPNQTTSDDIAIQPGFLGIGDRPWEVLMRFNEALPDDLYQIKIVGADAGTLVALRNTQGISFPTVSVASPNGPTQVDATFTMNLELGAKVLAVVPQPIVRNDVSGNWLTQQDNKVVVYFENGSEKLDAASAQNKNFYQFFATRNSVDPNDQVQIPAANITSVVYDPVANASTITFSAPLATILNGIVASDGSADPIKAVRLRIGTDEASRPSVPVVTLQDPDTILLGAGQSASSIGPGWSFETAYNISQGVVSIPLVSGGANYTSVPTIVISGGGGTGAAATATLSGGNTGSITSIKITSIGSGYTSTPTVTIVGGTGTPPAANFVAAVLGTATIGSFGEADISRVYSQSISPQSYGLAWPGGELEPGHRYSPAEDHLDNGTEPGVTSPDLVADTTGGVVTQYYNFRNEIGEISGGFTGIQRAYNVITPEQKQMAREIFDLYSRYSGVQFIERVNPTPLDQLLPTDPELNDIVVATGDFGIFGESSVPGGVIGLAGTVLVNANLGLLALRVAEMDNAESWSNLSGDAPAENGGTQQSWYVTAMHEIGHQLGLGHSYDLPARTVMGENPLLTTSIPESAFPGAADIAHMQHLYRPDSKDIDMYRFDVNQNGTLSVETMAERLHNASSLDTYITIWRETSTPDIDPATGAQVVIGGVPQIKKVRELVATNDDYFSKDSFLQIKIDQTSEFGTYYIGVTAKGNDRYDPNIADSGIGGTTEGNYELRLDFQRDASSNGSIKDLAGTLLDGDGDGRPGGVSNFWFRVAAPMEASGTRGTTARTIFVDKTSPATALARNGSPQRPFKDIDDALAVAQPFDIVRIVGNPGADGNQATTADNLAYKIGFNALNSQPLDDGSVLNVPKDVTVMIDAGAIFQLRQGWINVGSNSATTGADRSGGALQVLGTPTNKVYFTSYNEESTLTSKLGPTIGKDENTSTTEPGPGDWGGISFQQDVDKSDGRFTFDSRGIFIDYVNFADIRYGGGKVIVEGSEQVVTPIRMVSARPTVTNNTITTSADSAMMANPDSFEETNFRAPRFTKAEDTRLNPDYSRVGPEIRGNILVRTQDRQVTVGNVTTTVTDTYTNSTNGLFIRSATPTGGTLEKLTVTGRMDDIDIVHVVAENVIIAGTPGGVRFETAAPPVQLVVARLVTPAVGAVQGRFAAGTTYEYRVTFVDVFGNESPASNVINRTSFGGTLSPTTTGTVPNQIKQFIRLSQLPSVPQDEAGRNIYAGRRIYRREVGAGPEFRLVGVVPSTVSVFNDYNIPDAGLQQQLLDSGNTSLNRARPDGSLIVDPRVIMKLEGARIELEQGSTMIAEGLDGIGVVFTSLSDDRWGASGTFDTRGDDKRPTPAQPIAGDWAGIEARQDSRLSIDHAVIAYGGGVSRIESSISGNNAVEIIQADARITNVFFEHNAEGIGGQGAPQRAGRGGNDAGVIFIRSAQPVIANNTFINNTGLLAPVITINANALTADQVIDLGRQRPISREIANDVNNLTIDNDRIPYHLDNNGPLIVGNILENNTFNGMEVRGSTLTTESVWDDTDIVHLLLNSEVVVPDMHTFGGLRLESKIDQSLVVKSQGANAGLRATGFPLEISDRVGGRIQIVGQPGFPVIMTSITDDTASAGNRTDGRPQGDTNNNNLPLVLTPGVENASTGTLIDNDLLSATNGYIQYDVGFAGDSAANTRMKVPANGALLAMVNSSLSYVKIGSPPPVGTPSTVRTVALSSTTSIQAATRQGAEDLVVSSGSFIGDAQQTIVWTATSKINPGKLTVVTTYEFTSTTGNLGALQLISALDANVSAAGTNDILYIAGGSPGLSTFRLATLTNNGRYGIAQGGVYNASTGLVNATWDGYAASVPGTLTTSITSSAQTFLRTGSVAGLTATADASLGNIWGPGDISTAMAWTVAGTSTSAKITTFLDLIPVNPVNAGVAGEWRGIVLEQNSHDRNVAVVVESESDQPGNSFERNGNPDQSQFLGYLASSPKSGDETLRQGFTVNGVLRSNDDVDVYTFYADAGTEIWIDVDRTTHALDTVVELVDDTGKKLLMSDNSELEKAGGEVRYEDPLYVGKSLKMQKAVPYNGFDFYTTNPRDAAMRVKLYGPPGQHLYHLRMRSSNPFDGAAPGSPSALQDGIRRGLTKGAYQVEVRLQETDEFAGSAIQFADLRNAVTGIRAIGLPYHSPLVGEAGEVANENRTNDTRGTATNVGNLLTSDRGNISIAGVLGGLTNPQNRVDVDWYQFDVQFGATQLPVDGMYPIEIDTDFADGLGRPDVELYLYDSTGRLIAASRDSNVSDDRAAPNSTSNISDLSRGTVGASDALLGPIAVPTGRYFLAVASAYATANALSNDTSLRLEPINSTRRIVEDHIEDYIFTPFDPGTTTIEQPVIENLLNNDGSSAIPFTLGDVGLFVASERFDNSEGASLFMVDPFTGAIETEVRNANGNRPINIDIGDIAFRSNGQLYTYELDEDTTATDPTDDNESGRFYSIDTGIANPTLLGSDGIQTFELDATGTPVVSHLYNGARIGWGLQYNAMAFGAVNRNVEGERLLMVGNRGDAPGTASAPLIDNTNYIASRSNILYQANPNTGAYVGANVGIASRDLPNEPAPANNYPGGAFTPQYEVGEIPTQPIMTTVDVTTTTAAGFSNGINSFILRDGQQFLVDDGTGDRSYEFDSGPEIFNNASLIANLPSSPIVAQQGNTIDDGDFFLIDPNTTVADDETLVQFDSGISFTVNANVSALNAAQFDTALITINGPLGSVFFELDTNANVVTAGKPIIVATPANPTATPPTPAVYLTSNAVAVAIATAINAETANTGVTAQAAGTRISLVNNTGAGISPILQTSNLISIHGSAGEAPVLKFVPADVTNGTIVTFQVSGSTYTYNFVKDGGPQVGAGLPVNITSAMSGTAIAGALAGQILATAGFDLETKQVGDLLMVNGQQITYAGAVPNLTVTLPSVQVQIEESYPLSLAGSTQTVAAQLENIVNNNTNYVVGADANRINFPNFTEGSFATVYGAKSVAQAVNVFSVDDWLVVPSSAAGLLDTTAVRIPFLASDGNAGATALGQRIQMAINDAQPALNAVSQTDRVTLSNGKITIPGGTADPTCTLVRPINQLYTCGEGPGGFITGIANLRGEIYAVSDQGGLYHVMPNLAIAENAPNSSSLLPNNFVPTQYIGNSKDDLVGINFQGLTPGPQTTENGRYRDMLFAVDDGGRIYAISTVNNPATTYDDTGRLQPIFNDGAVYVDSGVTDARGLGFSALEENLWKITDLQNAGGPDERQPNVQHGINPAFDGSRAARGGVAGQGLDSSYHFGNNDRATYNFAGGAHGSIISNEFSLKGYAAADQPMIYFNYFNPSGPGDELRVSVSDDGGNWQAIMISGTQNDGNWHQARVGLGGFAGLEHLRLRFDFVTGGDLDVGRPETHGDELYALRGFQIDDGETFTLNDDLTTFASTTFEFDSGFSLNVGSGASIPNLTTFTVSNGTTIQSFRFIKPGTTAQANDILIRDAMTPRQVADAIGNAVLGAGIGITPRFNNDSDTAAPNDGTVNLQFATGLILGNTNLPGLTVSGASSYRFNAPEGINMVDGETLLINDGIRQVRFEFDSNGTLTSPPTNATVRRVGITFLATDTSVTLATKLQTAIQTEVAAGRLTVNAIRSANQVQIRGALLVLSTTTRTQGQTVVVDGVTNGNVPVRIHRGMSRVEVATAMKTAMERRYLAPTIVTADGTNFADGQVFSISDGTNVPVQFEIDTGYILRIPATGAQVPPVGTDYIAAGDSFTLANAGATLTFEFDDGTLPANGNPNVFRVAINSSFTQGTIARLIQNAIQTNLTLAARVAALGLNGSIISGGRVQLGGLVGVTFSATNNFNPARAGIAATVFGVPAVGANPRPGVAAGNIPISITASAAFTTAQVATAVNDAINASSLAGLLTTVVDPLIDNRITLVGSNLPFQSITMTGNTTPLSLETSSNIVRQYDSTIFAIGHDVFDAGVLGLENQLLTDPVFLGVPDQGINDRLADGAHFVRRGQDNNYEGPYIDDIVIGFRERGEMATYNVAQGANDTFTVPAGLVIANNLEGPYQVEIRRAAVFGTPVPVLAGTAEELARTFDTNDRINQSLQLNARSGGDLADGQTFTLSDGINYVTFEFDDATTPGAVRVAQGNLAISYLPTDTIEQISNKIRDAINSTDAQAVLNFAAATSDGILQTSTSTDPKVNVHGAASLQVQANPALEPNDVKGQEIVIDLNASDRPVYFVNGSIGDRNDLMNAIDPLTLGYSGGKDVDLFQLNLPAGATIHVDIDADILGSTLDAQLRIFQKDAAGNFVQVASNAAAFAPGETGTAGLLDPYLEFTAPAVVPAGTTFVIGVSAAGNTTYNPTNGAFDATYRTGATTGTYQLEITGSLNPSDPNFRPLLPSSLDFTVFNDKFGDSNVTREQGQLIISNNIISRMSNWGIVVDAAPRSAADGNSAHPGTVRQISQINDDRLAPGVVIMNNVIYNNNTGAILYSGDNSGVGPQAVVPYGRIVNNTLYGRSANDTAVQVEQNSSPTLVNNIVANFARGIMVDASSQGFGTQVAASVFQGNGINTNFLASDLDKFLAANDPLFISPASGNFYLKENSVAIDSAVKSLLDRTDMVRLREPLGIDPAPIVVSEYDIQGLKRIDDPSVSPPSGIGDNKYVDSGAVERADFTGPKGGLVSPLDNSTIDQDSTVNNVGLAGASSLREIVIQLLDSDATTGNNTGSGVDDTTVTSDLVIVTDASNGNRLLVDGVDYTFFYDATTNEIFLRPIGIEFAQPATYVVELDINNGDVNDTTPAIRDRAGNLLQSNGVESIGNVNTNVHKYTVAIGTSLDYGDAPASFPVTRANNGATHERSGNFRLGARLDLESDGVPSANADASSDDDGISNFNFVVNGNSSFTAFATENGKLDVWVDLNNDGTWTANEHLVVAANLAGGVSTTITIPQDKMAAAGGTTTARFRLTRDGISLPTGPAPDGEVEDYQVDITQPLFRNPDPKNLFPYTDGAVNPPRTYVVGYDVDNNKKIEPLDILWLVNLFYRKGSFNVPLPSPYNPALPAVFPNLEPNVVAPATVFYDVNGDNVANINDILALVYFINQPEYITYLQNLGNGEGEGESASFVSTPSVAVTSPVPETLYAGSNITVEVVTESQAQAAVDAAVFSEDGANGGVSDADRALLALAVSDEPESTTAASSNSQSVDDYVGSLPGETADDDLLALLASDVEESLNGRQF